MRTLLLPTLLFALAAAAPASAQSTPTADSSTVVVPSLPGEALRVTTADRQPPRQGRLARRYRGIRANRVASVGASVVSARPVAPTISTPRAAFIRRGGSYFQVVRSR